MILKIKAMGYRFDDIYVTIWAGDEQAGRLIFKPPEWDAFISALRSGAPNTGVTLNITEDIEDDLPPRHEDPACAGIDDDYRYGIDD